MSLSIVSSPTALPGCCKMCGGANKEWYLDTGTSEEYYGAVIYCDECVGHMASLCGYLTPAEKLKLETKITERDRKIFDMTVELDGMREIKRGLDLLGFSNFGAADVSGVAPNPVPLLEIVGSQPEAAGPEGSDNGSGTGETPEPSDDKGMAVVRPDEHSNAGNPFNLE